MNFLSNLSLPFKAIVSRRFYFDVMFHWKGVGLSYLFMLSAVIAIIATFPVKQTLQNLHELELSNVVAQIPASYVDKQGVLHAKQPTGQPVALRNSKGQFVVLYNPYDAPVEHTEVAVISMTAHSLIIQTQNGPVSVPWTAVYGNAGGDFEPLPVSQIMEESFNSGIVSTWIVVVLWFFSILAFIVLLAGLIGKFASMFIFKVQIPFVAALRLAAVGSTLVAILLVSQFFFALSLSYIFLTLIPVFYMVNFARDVRKLIDRSNADPMFAVSEENPLREWYRNKSADNGKLKEFINNSKAHENEPSQQAKQYQSNDEEKKDESKYALNDDWSDENEPIFDETTRHRSGEVKSGKNGEDSSFTP